MIDIILARYSASPTIYRTVDPRELFRSFSRKCLFSPVSNCSSSKADIPSRRNLKINLIMKFSYSKILEYEDNKENFLI